MVNKVVFYIFLCGISITVSAQQYSYVHYHSGTGAPFDEVNTVVQDQAGFLWIGSQNGLYRFDGLFFDLYSIHTKSQYIHRLQKRGDQLLFVNDLGIYQIDDLFSDPGVTSVLEGSIHETPELPFYPNDFILGKEQEIWLAQSSHSLGRFQEGRFTTYPLSKTKKEQKLAIQQDPEGGIWVLSPVSGLFYFDENTSSFEKKLDVKKGTALLIHENRLVVGNDALHIYSRQGKTLKLLRTIELADDGPVTAMYSDRYNQFIIGTSKGNLFTLSDLNASPQAIYGANEAHRVEKLDFGFVNEIYVTRDSQSKHENLWICAETGLWLLQKRFFRTVKDLPMVNPIAIAISDEGKAWVPINYLYEIAPSKDEFKARPIYDNNQVSAVAHDNKGYTWISTANPRVSILKYRNNRLVRTYDEFRAKNEGIFNLYADSKGNLWFCRAPSNQPVIGIAMINGKDEVVYYDETKGFSSRVLAIKESARGEIYAVGIGEESYLYQFDPEKDRFVNLSPVLPFRAKLNFEVHDLTIDERGVVWLATTDGLLRYDAESVTRIENDVLGEEEVRGVTHYSNNNIWVATATKGLVYHQQNTSTVLGELEGLPGVISTYRCITSDNAGRLWAGTAEGLVYSRISAATLPLSNMPRIRKISIDRREFSPFIDEALSIRQNQELSFMFTNLSFPARNVQYEYRLMAREDREIMLEEQPWLSHGTNNDLTLSQLDLGDYILEVRAIQPGGFQWSKPLEIPFTVFKPWYFQNSFIFGLAGLLMLLLAYYLRIFGRRRYKKLLLVLKSSNEKIRKQEAQLHQKIREFEEQKEQLDNANLNINTLELFIREIPKKASWNDIISAMGKAVELSPDVDAFEIAFKEEDEIVHRGYSELERSGFTFRSKPFDTKTSLTCWAMANNQEVLINDFDGEHTLYIEEKAAYRFRSLLFIPFTLANDQQVVLCAYSTHKNHFDRNDQVMFRILAKFIHFSIREEISKKI